jgi:hypothetical protein
MTVTRHRTFEEAVAERESPESRRMALLKRVRQSGGTAAVRDLKVQLTQGVFGPLRKEARWSLDEFEGAIADLVSDGTLRRWVDMPTKLDMIQLTRREGR